MTHGAFLSGTKYGFRLILVCGENNECCWHNYGKLLHKYNLWAFSVFAVITLLWTGSNSTHRNNLSMDVRVNLQVRQIGPKWYINLNFEHHFSIYFGLVSQYVLKNDLLKIRMCPIWNQSDPFWAQIWHRLLKQSWIFCTACYGLINLRVNVRNNLFYMKSPRWVK